jgi:hypothetical protein
MEPVAGPLGLISTVLGLSSQRQQFVVGTLKKAATLTGIKWIQGTQGDYTSSNYNGVGLYSYSAGTWTLVASSTDDGNIWKAASGIASKAFSSTYNAAAGVYAMSMLYCSTGAVTTIPTIGNYTAASSLGGQTLDFTNSASIFGRIASRTSLISSTAASGLTVATNNTFALFAY